MEWARGAVYLFWTDKGEDGIALQVGMVKVDELVEVFRIGGAIRIDEYQGSRLMGTVFRWKG